MANDNELSAPERTEQLAQLSDAFLALSSAQGERFEQLCAKLSVGKASEHEAIEAIRDLCRDNERLAVLAGKKAGLTAENTSLRADLSATVSANALLVVRDNEARTVIEGLAEFLAKIKDRTRCRMGSLVSDDVCILAQNGMDAARAWLAISPQDKAEGG